MRRAGQRLRAVRDQSGRLCGLVTIAALLAPIVGNIPRDTTGDRKADKDAPVVFNAAGKEV
jgi:CBS domain containing-hemolysin-like protein